MEKGSVRMEHLDFIGIESALKKLKPEQMQLIQLAYFQGYTQEEIAEETGIPLGTVKTRIRAAIQVLRLELHN
jgi:RNA polymerase sigma-70 factor (ECF subfamily)